MTIAERINLHRCGYSRAEIDALAQEEKEARAAEEPVPAQGTSAAVEPAPAQGTSAAEEPVPAQGTPAAGETQPDPVLEAIKGLTAAIQASNINKTPQPEAKQETVTDLLKNL